MTAPTIPPALAAHMREIGIYTPPPAKPRDWSSDLAARTGVITQWKPTPGDTEPPF